MADPILTYGVGLQESMGAGLRTPRSDLYSNLPSLGTQGIRSGLADVEVERQQALDRIAGLGAPSAPRLQPPPESAMQAGPDIYYSPGMDRFSVGGVEFGREDYDVALQSPSYLGRQAPAPTGGDWRRIDPLEYQGYLSSISEGRGFFGNIGMGFRDVGQGLVGGAGRGLQMLGAEDVGGALVGAGEAIGPSAADQARDAAIAEQQGLLGKIGTAAVRSIPTLGLSVLGGLGAAGLAVRAGAAAGSLTARGAALGGVATTILPMELQSSWQAAEQGGYDTADPAVRDEILLSALLKTAGQTVAPAFIASGFSPALRRVVSESAQRTMGSRIARGVGAGALEGSAEAFAQIVDRVAFDPELRAQFNEADWAALAPLIVNKYGEEALVAFGAGFLLGGPLGALGTPEQAAPPPPPRRPVDSGQPVDVLSGATLSPQAEPGTQGELFPGADLGQTPPEPMVLAPEQRVGRQLDLPFPEAPAPVETQLELPLPAPVGAQGDLFGAAPPIPAAAPQPAPLALPSPTQGGTVIPQAPLQLGPALQPTLPLTPQQRADVPMPLLPQQRAEPGQVEMFTPTEMGVGPATQARLTGQQLAGMPRIPVTAPPETTQADLEAAGQQRMELTTQPTAMGEQLAAIREQQNRLRQQAEQAAATRARREAEFEAAQRQAAQQREAERQQMVDAEVAWEQLRPEGSRVTFDRLTPTAQRQWSEAVSGGTADQALFDDLRRRVRPGRAQPLLETPTPLTEPEAAPAPTGGGGRPEPAGSVEVYRARPVSGGTGVGEAAYGIGVYYTSSRGLAEDTYAPMVVPVTIQGPSGTVTINQRDALARPSARKALKDAGVPQTDKNLRALYAAVEGKGSGPEGASVTVGESEVVTETIDTTTVEPQTSKAKLRRRGRVYDLKKPADIAALRKQGLTGTSYEQDGNTNYVMFPTEGETDALQKPSAAQVDVRQQAADGQAVGEGDAQVQETPQARVEEAPRERVTPAPGRGLSEAEREAAARSARAADLLIGRDRRQPAQRTQEQLEADRAREEAARAEVARRTETEAAARREAEQQVEVPVAPVAQSEAARAWAEAQRENPDIDIDYDALPNAEKTRWAKEVRAGKQTAEKARRAYERVAGPLAEREAAAEAEALVTAVQDLELDVVQRGFDNQKRDSAVELVRLRDDPDTPANVRDDIVQILETNLTRSQLTDVETLVDGGDLDTKIITDLIETINAGGTLTDTGRRLATEAWRRVKGGNPQYNGRPLADYITGGPDFFNYGPRVNGHRQVVAKGAGRTSRITFNFIGGAFNNLDGSSINRALPHGKAKMVISTFRRKLKRAPSIKTFTNVAQLKRKDPALYARAAAARPQGDFDNVTAAGYSFGDGEVLIFTDNVANEAHLRFVLAHETMGHYGLRGFIPAAEFDKTMESIYDTFPHIQGPVDAAMARVEGLSKAEAVEEYLSDYAALLENNLILRVWNAVKNVLNSLGLKFADDYARYLVNHARQYARKPGTGHFADMDIIAQRANGVETGVIAPGRYKRSDDVFGTLERTMSTARLMFGDRPLPKKAKAKATTDIPNNMEAFKNEFLSLFQFQQRKNPGLQRLGEIVQAGVDNSLYIRNILNETMAPALNLAVRIPGTNIRFGGRTPEEIKLTNDALAVTRIRASQRLRDDPKLSQSKTPIFRFNETTGEFDETGEAERLDSLTRLTLDEFRSGFTAELKRDTGEVQKFVFEGDPTATEKSGAWIAYNALRDGLLEAEKRLLKAKLQANTTTIDAALEEIASLTPTNRLDAEQRRLIRKAAQLYSDLYRKGAGINPQTGEIQADAGAITKAEEFLAAFNTAIIADKPASVDTDLSNKDSAASRNKALAEIIQREASKQEADDIVASIEKFKDVVRREGKNPLQQDKFFIQQKIASLNAAQFTADNGEQGFRTTIVGQYTPITQEGKYQGRVVPVDARTGEPVVLGDAYGGSMGYTQFETQSEADAFAESFRNLMVDDNGDPLVFDVDIKGPAGETISGKVRFEMRVDDVETEVTAPLQLNLNEFMLGVARYSIPLKPSKMEEILTDLTRQDDRARKRLLTEFTAGDPRNGTKNIATHVDGRASTISKTLMRPEIERLMSRRNKRSRELWDGDPKRVEVTRNRYERLMADPGASREQVDAARRDYEEAQMLFNETGGRPNKFKNQAGKLLAFMNDNERLTESNFDSNEYIARWRNLTAIFQLGASLATAALNPVSVFTNVAPYLATRNAKTAFGGGFGMGRTMYEINRAFKLVGLPGTLPNKASAKYNEASFWESVSNDKALQEKYKVTDFEARMLAQEIRQGSMQPALTNTMSQTARGMATTGVGQKAVDGMMFMFNVSEQASRRAAGLAAFRMEFARRTNAIDPDIKAGTPEYDAAVEQAYRDSVKFVSNMLRETLGEYSVVNRPNFFRSGIAGMLYMYKVFPTTSIQLFRNMDMKGKAWMLLGLWMLGGIAAFPFAEDIEDLLDTLEQKFGIGFGSPSVRATLAAELEAIQPGLARWVLSGVGGQVLPFDVASRVALSPLPATEFFLAGTDRGRMYEEILGPMPSAAMGATQFVVDAVRAPFSPTITAEDVAREAPITGIRLLADTYAYLNSGAIVDRRGYVVSPDVQWYDIAARLAGFYPSSAAQEYSTIRIVNRIANYRREMSAQFRSEWVQARIRNDRDRMREIEEEVRDWNRENRGTPLQIDNFRQGAQRAYRDAIRPATERTLRTTPTAGRNEFEAIMESLTR